MLRLECKLKRDEAALGMTNFKRDKAALGMTNSRGMKLRSE
jgi:hypothetical protein